MTTKDTEQLAKVIRKNRFYVTAIKRILRAAGQVVDDLSVTELETRLRDVTKYAPGVTARGLARLYENAARAWERGNNSGNSETLSAEEQRCDDYRNTADAILMLWDVTADYPGLYPCFKWQGRDYYDTESLFRWISEESRRASA